MYSLARQCLARLYKVQEELLHYPPALASASELAKCESFYVKVFYVLTGELSCPVTGLVIFHGQYSASYY